MLTKFDKALAALIVSGLVPILNYLFGWTLSAEIQAVAVTVLTGFFVWLVPNKQTDDGGSFKSLLPVLLLVGALPLLGACAMLPLGAGVVADAAAGTNYVASGYAALCDELGGTYDPGGRGSCDKGPADLF